MPSPIEVRPYGALRPRALVIGVKGVDLDMREVDRIETLVRSVCGCEALLIAGATTVVAV